MRVDDKFSNIISNFWFFCTSLDSEEKDLPIKYVSTKEKNEWRINKWWEVSVYKKYFY